MAKKVSEFFTLLFFGNIAFYCNKFMAFDFNYYPKYGGDDAKLISVSIGCFCLQISSGIYE